MLKLNKLLKGAALTAAGLSITASAAFAEKVLRIQSVLPNTADEVVMLKDFGADVAALTNGSLVIEVLPAGAVVCLPATCSVVAKIFVGMISIQ